MFKRLFSNKKSESDHTILAPLEGTVLPLENVPDPVFSQKMIGDGFAIDPTNGNLVAPVDGVVMNIFPTKHAISLKDLAGREILIHVGIETVSLNGEGFTPLVKDGQKIKKGQKLMEINFDSIRNKVPSIITPIVFTNLSENEKISISQQEIKIMKTE